MKLGRGNVTFFSFKDVLGKGEEGKQRYFFSCEFMWLSCDIKTSIQVKK